LKRFDLRGVLALVALAAALSQPPTTALAVSAEQVDRGAKRALENLYAKSESEPALKWIDKSDGWEIGAGPSLVVVDIGAAGSLTSTTAQSDIYAFFFDQKGLMAGLGLQGTKITKLDKAPTVE
jgi:lipid-binding SYLF domain-containing protein